MKENVNQQNICIKGYRFGINIWNCSQSDWNASYIKKAVYKKRELSICLGFFLPGSETIPKINLPFKNKNK